MCTIFFKFKHEINFGKLIPAKRVKSAEAYSSKFLNLPIKRCRHIVQTVHSNTRTHSSNYILQYATSRPLETITVDCTAIRFPSWAPNTAWTGGTSPTLFDFEGQIVFPFYFWLRRNGFLLMCILFARAS